MRSSVEQREAVDLVPQLLRQSAEFAEGMFYLVPDQISNPYE